MKRILSYSLLTLIVVSMSASYTFAASISDTFNAGVFDIPWGASIEDVKESFPGGITKTEYGINSYIVKDSRKLFGLDREDGNNIVFYLSRDWKFNSLAAYFPFSDESFGFLFSKLESTFGPFTNKHMATLSVSLEWNDSGTIKLFLIRDVIAEKKISVIISNIQVSSPVNKEDLGL